MIIRKTTISGEEFIRKVKFSESRRKKYYTKRSELPKKYKSSRYIWKIKPKTQARLYDTLEKEFVVSNPRAVGTPNQKPINGQLIWNGGLKSHSRNKMAGQIKDKFYPYFAKIPFLSDEELKDKPFKVKIIYHTFNEHKDIDNLNLIYQKVILDIIKNTWLPEDNLEFINKLEIEHKIVNAKTKEKIIISLTT